MLGYESFVRDFFLAISRHGGIRPKNKAPYEARTIYARYSLKSNFALLPVWMRELKISCFRGMHEGKSDFPIEIMINILWRMHWFYNFNLTTLIVYSFKLTPVMSIQL